MRKPTAKVFFGCYLVIWISFLALAVYHAPPGGAARAMIFVNLVAVCINLIGTAFALNGWAPWRDDDAF